MVRIINVKNCKFEINILNISDNNNIIPDHKLFTSLSDIEKEIIKINDQMKKTYEKNIINNQIEYLNILKKILLCDEISPPFIMFYN